MQQSALPTSVGQEFTGHFVALAFQHGKIQILAQFGVDFVVEFVIRSVERRIHAELQEGGAQHPMSKLPNKNPINDRAELAPLAGANGGNDRAKQHFFR